MFLLGALLGAQDWRSFVNGKNLEGWEIRGDSVWTVLKDGMLVGQRPDGESFWRLAGYAGAIPAVGWSPILAVYYRGVRSI
jgi:hypothetical protein